MRESERARSETTMTQNTLVVPITTSGTTTEEEEEVVIGTTIRDDHY